MKEMIFGIGTNPSFDEEEFEEDGIEGSPFWVYLTDKKTWEEEGCCNDNIDPSIMEKMREAGFCEAMEAIYEPTDQIMNSTKEELMTLVQGFGFEYDEKFSSFMSSAMG